MPRAANAKTTKTSVPAKGRRLSSVERREEFLDKAAELLVEHGIAAVTMETIAATMGVSKGLGYWHFANRDELLKALIVRELAVLSDRQQTALIGAWRFDERLRAWLEVNVANSLERGRVLRGLLEAAYGHHDLEGPILGYRTEVEAFWQRGIEEEYGASRDRAGAGAKLVFHSADAAIRHALSSRHGAVRTAELYAGMILAALESLR